MRQWVCVDEIKALVARKFEYNGKRCNWGESYRVVLRDAWVGGGC